MQTEPKEKISIIVPVYNTGPYLSECLDSIRNQTYTNYEAIIIDDGSTDNSLEICMEYAAQDPRFQVLHCENKGVGFARNKGLDSATGKYICFVDSDDYLDDKYLEFLISHISDCDFVSCAASFVDSNGNLLKRNEYSSRRKVINEDIFGVYLHTNFIEDAPWNKLYQACLFSDLRFMEGVIFEDSELIVRLLKKCSKILFTSEYLYNYRIRDNSILDYQNSDVDEKAFNMKKLDLLKVYDSCIQQLDGTAYQKGYIRRIIFQAADYNTAITQLSQEKQSIASNYIHEYYEKYKRYLYSLFSLKEMLVILGQIHFPSLYTRYRSKRG